MPTPEAAPSPEVPPRRPTRQPAMPTPEGGSPTPEAAPTMSSPAAPTPSAAQPAPAPLPVLRPSTLQPTAIDWWRRLSFPPTMVPGPPGLPAVPPSNPPSQPGSRPLRQPGQQLPSPTALLTEAPTPSPTTIPTPQPSGSGQGGADAASSGSSSGSTTATSTETIIIVVVIVILVACCGFLFFGVMRRGHTKRSPYEIWMHFQETKKTRMSSGFEDLYAGSPAPPHQSVEMQSHAPGFLPYLSGRASFGRSSLNNGARASSISAQRFSLTADAFRRSSLANRASLSPAPGTHHSRK